ncbi:MAG: metal-dependent hydrolase [Desulfovibrio sp.]|jgi:inner membrane protein|nr:metal-dependent hydrolase [Desulfovibrio sp.]
MDSLTHLAAGALVPLAFRNAPKRAGLVLFGIAAGEFPDADVFFGHSPEAAMTIHRGFTHSLLVQPVSALILALAFFFLLTRTGRGGEGLPRQRQGWQESLDGFGFRGLFLAGLLALYLHVYLDCMTSFGTRIFLPFSPVRVGLPAMFIIDILCTLPALWLLWIALRRRNAPQDGSPKEASGDQARFFSGQTRRCARLGLAWLFFYPLACLAVNAGTTLYLESALAGTEDPAASQKEAAPQHAGTLHLLPEPFSPFVWKVLADDGDSYRMGIFDLSAGTSFLPFSRFDKPKPGLWDSLEKQDAFFAAFREFSPFLIARINRADERETEYAFMDLRYVVAEYSPLRLLWGRTKTVFVLEARVSAEGRLLAYRFLRDSTRQETPWTLPDGTAARS